MSRKHKYTHWLANLDQEKTKQLKKAEKTSIEQKLVKAKILLNNAALQFEKIGLNMTFEIKIRGYL